MECWVHEALAWGEMAPLTYDYGQSIYGIYGRQEMGYYQ